MTERRRQDEFVTHAELRVALKPLFDLKARVEPPLRFYDLMQPLGLEKLLPQMLQDETVRQVLRNASGIRWRQAYRWGLAIGAVASVSLIGSFLLNLYFFFFAGHK